jgi:hypothetical protein
MDNNPGKLQESRITIRGKAASTLQGISLSLFKINSVLLEMK